MSSKSANSKDAVELEVLRLAAMAIDVRARLSSHQIQRIPSLEIALNALDQVMREMGWADEASLQHQMGHEEASAARPPLPAKV